MPENRGKTIRGDYSNYEAVFYVLESIRNGRNSADIDRIEKSMAEIKYSVPIMEGTKARQNLLLAMICLWLHSDADFQRLAEHASDTATVAMEKIEETAKSVAAGVTEQNKNVGDQFHVEVDKRTLAQRMHKIKNVMAIHDVSEYGVPNDIYGRYALRTGMPYDVVKKNYESAKAFGVDPHLTMAMMYVESRGRKYVTDSSGNRVHVESGKGAIGPMQIMPFNAPMVKKLYNADIYDPYENIYGGCGMFKDLLKRFRHPELAVAAYNAGPGAVIRNSYSVPINGETEKYVNNVMDMKYALDGEFGDM